MLIVDAHLDLAYNVTRGRDLRMPARQQPVADNEIATVGLPDLRDGDVGLVCATLFAEPASERRPNGYRDANSAHIKALSQLAWYDQQVRDGQMWMVRTPADVPQARADPLLTRHPEQAGDASAMPDSPPRDGVARGSHATANPQPFIVLMEGADPIRSQDDVPLYFDAGVRIVGLAWKRTRFAGGTSQPGPLTPQGRELVPTLDRFNIIHDASHLAEESFWNLLDLSAGPVIASHSNCRAIVPGDRHLTDEMILAIAARGGVIGVNLFDKFLLPPTEYGKRRATLADVVGHMKHMCDLIGNAVHVGIGTDMDGGLGREQVPQEIETIADLHRLSDALSAGGFPDAEVKSIMGENWLRYFHQHLPAAGPAAGATTG
jgi:membrane dipeptidase